MLFPSEVQQIQSYWWGAQRWSIEGRRASACRPKEQKKEKEGIPANHKAREEPPSPPPPAATPPLPLELSLQSPHTRHFTDPIWPHSSLFLRDFCFLLASSSSKVPSSWSQKLTSCFKALHRERSGGFHHRTNFQPPFSSESSSPAWTVSLSVFIFFSEPSTHTNRSSFSRLPTPLRD